MSLYDKDDPQAEVYLQRHGRTLDKIKTGDTAHVVAMMKATGNQPGLIQRWKALVADWAATSKCPDSAAVKAWLPNWQVRPFYTAEELAPLWPALAIVTGATTQWPKVPKSPARLANELDFVGLPRLSFARNFFICERIHYWRNASDADVMRELQNAYC